MSYFKINDMDISSFISDLSIEFSTNYNAQTNAAGNTVVDYINQKRIIKVKIIPLFSKDMIALQQVLHSFQVSISFRNPQTNTLEQDVKCIIPKQNIDYYTIQANKVMYKALSLEFIEL